jgi:Predicted nucleotide-binding protein containing TIR-like domain
MRRRIFVGSSTEDLRLANAHQRNLVNCGHTVTVWNQGTFSIGRTVFDSLLAALEKVDAAVFVSPRTTKAEPAYIFAAFYAINRVMNDQKLTRLYVPLMGR